VDVSTEDQCRFTAFLRKVASPVESGGSFFRNFSFPLFSEALRGQSLPLMSTLLDHVTRLIAPEKLPFTLHMCSPTPRQGLFKNASLGGSIRFPFLSLGSGSQLLILVVVCFFSLFPFGRLPPSFFFATGSSRKIATFFLFLSENNAGFRRLFFCTPTWLTMKGSRSFLPPLLLRGGYLPFLRSLAVKGLLRASPATPLFRP